MDPRYHAWKQLQANARARRVPTEAPHLIEVMQQGLESEFWRLLLDHLTVMQQHAEAQFISRAASTEAEYRQWWGYHAALLDLVSLPQRVIDTAQQQRQEAQKGRTDAAT